jgi:hypothetical protein
MRAVDARCNCGDVVRIEMGDGAASNSAKKKYRSGQESKLQVLVKQLLCRAKVQSLITGKQDERYWGEGSK